MHKRPFLLLICLPLMLAATEPEEAGVPGAPEGATADLLAAYRAKTQAVRRCDRSGGGIVVCGNREERNARERLPLPREQDGGGTVRGEAPAASAARVKQGSCGVDGGQGAGCTGGLDVFRVANVLGKAVTAIIDPDADLAPPPPLPDRYRGATPR